MADVLRQFPHVDAAFSYGSGVFAQGAPGSEARRTPGAGPMIDYIFAVGCPLEWHRQNIEANRHHYSCLAAFGPQAVTRVANGIGVGVHFNTFVPWKDRLIKYGVVQTASLCSDLRDWHSMYIAGRLHKPVRHHKRHPDVDAGMTANQQAALGLGLLLQPESFTMQSLLESICGLSYLSDIRMAFAEDSNKVRNIVAGSRQQLEELYSGHMTSGVAATAADLRRASDQRWDQDASSDSRAALVSQLPQGLLSVLATSCGAGAAATRLPAASAAQEIARAALRSPDYRRLLLNSVGSIVRASSRRQAVAGLLAAGALRSFQYGSAKLAKAWNSRR